MLAALTAFAWLIVEWNSPGAGAAFTAGLVLYAAWPPLLAHAALRHADRSLSRPAIALLAVAYADSLLVLGVGLGAVLRPVEQGCLDCPANRLLASARAAGRSRPRPRGLSIAAAWSAAFAALALARLARATSARRRVELPVVLPAAAAVALFGARALHGAERGFLSNDPTDRALWARRSRRSCWSPPASLGARARAAHARARSPGRRARSIAAAGRVARPARRDVRRSLAPAAARPRRRGRLARRRRPAGRPPADDPDRQVTRLLAGGRELSAIVHRPGLLEDPALAAELAAAARLALEHERLNAIRRAQLESLRASRARIVATADAERRSLERDLHDGAQQRLATVAVAIRLARRQLAAGDRASMPSSAPPRTACARRSPSCASSPTD